MNAITAALVPVFLLIAVGYGFRRGGFPGDAFWPLAEQLTYFVLFPALLIYHLATARLADYGVVPLTAALISPVLVVSAIVLLLYRWLGLNGPAFTSLFQGSIRFNTYVGLAGAAAVYPDRGLILAALVVAISIPPINILSVTALSHFSANNRALGWRGVVLALARNPLILACLLGLLLNVSGIGLPGSLEPMLEILGRGALPLGLLAVGAGLDFRSARAATGTIVLASTLKLLLLPVLTALACRVFGVTGIAAGVAVLFAALPTATSAYILAGQLGGDQKIMAAILTLQTGLAVVTLPMILILLT